MFAERKRVAILERERLCALGELDELRNERKCLCRCGDGCVRVLLDKFEKASGVVGFQMVDNQVVGRFALQCIFNICQPFTYFVCVYGIRDRNLLVKNHVGIVRNSVRNLVLPFKQINLAVIHSNELNVFTKIQNVHKCLQFFAKI